ncbi:hypothetical protein [Cellulosilyticum sp. WCF-2]|uniref:hypothetical protein n=1 Tax=Cellulosilyticum sp. WCF-2 TaxID=2497860 RepID=UPI000F8E595A|nr:hypothetical protein [Cellulosilyticum sp. WCF-2]QEH69945.1 hypothetical protein EKH84_16705 [Cellulosilyticum sp. WCF-2]
MIKEKRIPCFVNVCEKCGEILVLPKQDHEVPNYCHICGNKTSLKSGYITQADEHEVTVKNQEEKNICVNSIEDIEKVLYKQVELLAENSKECEPDELVEMTKCILNIYNSIPIEKNFELDGMTKELEKSIKEKLSV